MIGININAKYFLLETDDIILEGDEYYNIVHDEWMPVEEWNTEWRVDEHKPVRRKNPNT